MADARESGQGLRGSVRRAVGGAFDATVGRVGDAVGEVALDVTGTTAQQVIEELEPYLIEEAIPRIVDGITPYLAGSVVPEVLEGVQEHLVRVTVPEVVDGVTEHLVGVTVPAVVAGVTPRLVADLLPRLLEDLRPYLEEELAPRIIAGLIPELSAHGAPDLVDALMPKIEAEVAPRLVESLMPTIEQRVAPQLIEALMPTIRDQVAPDLVDALMPKIEAEVAPRLVESLMPTIEQQVAPQLIEALMPRIEQDIAPRLIDAVLPKIRTEVVPTILDDIVDDPRVRDLIREQSQGLFLDAFESLRENLADGDDIVENVFRRLLRRPPRPVAESGLELVLDATSSGAAASRRTLRELEQQRAAWQSTPAPPAPPGREFAFAGVVTRGIALAVDISLTGWLISQGLSALVGLLDSLLNPVPGWLTAILTFLSVNLVPMYLAVAWTWMGRSLGGWLVGLRVCTPDGRRLGLVRAIVRAWLLVFLLVIWVATGFVALFDKRRRTVLDMLIHTEERYLVPDNQQRRYLREAVLARSAAAQEPQAGAPSGAGSVEATDDSGSGTPADSPR